MTTIAPVNIPIAYGPDIDHVVNASQFAENCHCNDPWFGLQLNRQVGDPFTHDPDSYLTERVHGGILDFKREPGTLGMFTLWLNILGGIYVAFYNAVIQKGVVLHRL